MCPGRSGPCDRPSYVLHNRGPVSVLGGDVGCCVFHKASLWVVIAVAALVSPVLAAKVELPGQVTYNERVALPDGATLRIQLVDETLPNAPARLAVEAPIGPGQVPLSFTLAFEDTLILPGHSYALIASINAGGGLLFRNFEPYAVNPLAPAAPVLIVASLVGQIVTGSASSAKPVVDAPPAILDSTWRAVSINGALILPRTMPTLAIGNDLRAGGSGGCNSWFAEARLDQDTIHFGSITSTQRGCTQTIGAQEQAFHEALTAAATWRVAGDELTLFGMDGKALLTFHR